MANKKIKTYLGDIGSYHLGPFTFDTFLSTLFCKKKSNFSSRRIKVSTFVANDLSFLLS